MNDRELLELAAKAAGYQHRFDDGTHYIKGKGLWLIWNPGDDDGDALRLAVDLGLLIRTDYFGKTECCANDVVLDEPHGKDPYAATRRAIVRAAAEIGRRME